MSAYLSAALCPPAGCCDACNRQLAVAFRRGPEGWLLLRLANPPRLCVPLAAILAPLLVGLDAWLALRSAAALLFALGCR